MRGGWGGFWDHWGRRRGWCLRSFGPGVIVGRGTVEEKARRGRREAQVQEGARVAATSVFRQDLSMPLKEVAPRELMVGRQESRCACALGLDADLRLAPPTRHVFFLSWRAMPNWIHSTYLEARRWSRRMRRKFFGGRESR